jgi:hypothetical protein
MMEDETMGIEFGELKVPALLWVDDVAIFSLDQIQQEKTLDIVHEFSVKHRFE